MSSNSIGPNNLFYIFSGISVLATAYSIIFIKETKGLSDKQKKLLYTPKQYLIDNDMSLDADQISQELDMEQLALTAPNNHKFDYTHKKIWILYSFCAALSFTISNETISEITSKTGPVCIFYFSSGGIIAGAGFHLINCI